MQSSDSGSQFPNLAPQTLRIAKEINEHPPLEPNSLRMMFYNLVPQKLRWNYQIYNNRIKPQKAWNMWALTHTHTHTETVISGLVYFFFDNIQAINSVTWLALGRYMWITCCEGILGSYDGLCFSSFFFFFLQQ